MRAGIVPGNARARLTGARETGRREAAQGAGMGPDGFLFILRG